MPYYFGDLKRDLHLENYCSDFAGVSMSFGASGLSFVRWSFYFRSPAPWACGNPLPEALKPISSKHGISKLTRIIHNYSDVRIMVVSVIALITFIVVLTVIVIFWYYSDCYYSCCYQYYADYYNYSDPNHYCPKP